MIPKILDEIEKTKQRVADLMGLGMINQVKLILIVDPITELEILRDKDFRPKYNGVGEIYACDLIIDPSMKGFKVLVELPE